MSSLLQQRSYLIRFSILHAGRVVQRRSMRMRASSLAQARWQVAGILVASGRGFKAQITT
ncbi:MAG: hypothetical protein ACRD1K_20535 [Acidimicrobiales bacterium]